MIEGGGVTTTSGSGGGGNVTPAAATLSGATSPGTSRDAPESDAGGTGTPGMSQSQDCEPTPPVVPRGNFFQPLEPPQPPAYHHHHHHHAHIQPTAHHYTTDSPRKAGQGRGGPGSPHATRPSR